MDAMTTARRSLLPPDALGLLAQRAEVPLPPGWAPAEPAAAAAALLVRAGLVDADSGAVREDLAAALAPLRAPVASIEVTLAPTSPRPPAAIGEPAEAFTAAVVVGDDGVVTLLRRDGVALVELGVTGIDGIRPALERVVACVPVPEPARVVEGRMEVGAFVALSTHEERFDVETFAAAHDCEPDRVAAVAELLAAVTHVLRLLVVGHRTAGGPGVGQVLLYRSAPGWLSVTAEGPDVVLRSTEPLRSIDAAVPLLAGVL